MAQSSLLVWLNQPKSIKEPPPTENDDGNKPLQLQVPQNENVQMVAGDGNAVSPTKTSTFATNLKPMPPNVELRSCYKEDIPHVKRLTSLLLPIPYPEKFYKEIIEDQLTNDITLLAVWHDEPAMIGRERGRIVGVVRCRLFVQPHSHSQPLENGSPMLYLSTLALLSPYQNHGIATHLLTTLTRRAVENYGVSSVGAHVWEANVGALEWYRKRGFREVGKEADYYRRLDPKSAVVMRRDISVLDYVGREG